MANKYITKDKVVLETNTKKYIAKEKIILETSAAAPVGSNATAGTQSLLGVGI